MVYLMVADFWFKKRLFRGCWTAILIHKHDVVEHSKIALDVTNSLPIEILVIFKLYAE